MAGARKKPSPSGRYQGFFIDSTGKKRYFTGSTRRSETVRIARKLEEDHREIRLGYREPRQTHFKYRDRSFMDTVSEYLGWGKLQGGHKGRPWSESHASRKERHLELWAETLELKVLADLDNLLPRVEATLRELAKRGKSGKTIANITEALCSFCNWCVIRGYLSENPSAKLAVIDTTPEEEYRALTIEETRRLLRVAPEHLRLLYIIAMTTGLRANELRSLTRKHLDTDNNVLILEPAWTKNRKLAFQPLPKRLVKELESYSASGIVQALYRRFYRNFVCPQDALLYVPSHPARELDKDLKTAKIPKHTKEGKVAFHALRTSFVTLTYEAGANHKEAQQLARHSTPTLTANTYGRARNERLAEVAEKVADRLLLADTGANMVHATENDDTTKIVKLLPEQQLTNDTGNWRRGDSNPRPEMFRDKLLHA
jgi:integrase